VTIRAFLRLVGEGQIDEARRWLAAFPDLVNATGPHPFWGGCPQPLHVAIETRQWEVFSLLLDKGADVNGTNDQYDHWSPLMLAADQTAMRDELLRRGARVGLTEALLLADDSLVKELLRGGTAALPAAVPNGGSILNFARTPYAIDRLIELGAPTGQQDRWGATPIRAMSRLGARRQSLVRHLVAHGVTASAEDYARLGDLAALEALVKADPGTARDAAVLMGAVEFGHPALAQWLLAQGADVNARASDRSHQTALHAAAWKGDLAMVKLLVGAGADIMARDDEHKGTPSDWAEVAIVVTRNEQCRTVLEYLTVIPAGGH
jgi:ankyrin repeat protein